MMNLKLHLVYCQILNYHLIICQIVIILCLQLHDQFHQVKYHCFDGVVLISSQCRRFPLATISSFFDILINVSLVIKVGILPLTFSEVTSCLSLLL